jgi:hypothetical protein
VLLCRHGKRVAVKVMQLPANSLLGQQQQQQQQQPGARTSSLPAMAISEAVLSSSLSHPNLVQVSQLLRDHMSFLITIPISAAALATPTWCS